MKETIWQVLSKHLPLRTDLYEPTECALALLTTTASGCGYLSAQVHLRNFQSEGCILAPFLPVCNLIPHPLSWHPEPLVAVSLPRHPVQSASPDVFLTGRKMCQVLAEALPSYNLRYFGLYNLSVPSWRFCRVLIPSLPHHSALLFLSSRKDR